MAFARDISAFYNHYNIRYLFIRENYGSYSTKWNRKSQFIFVFYIHYSTLDILFIHLIIHIKY